MYFNSYNSLGGLNLELPARISPTTLWWKSWSTVLLLLLLLLDVCTFCIVFAVFPLLLLKFWFCCIINICLGVNMGLWGPKKCGWWGGGIIGGGCPPEGWWKSPFGGWGKGGLKKGLGPIIGWGGAKPGGPGNPFIRAAAAAAKNGWCLKKRHILKKNTQLLKPKVCFL